MKKKILLKTQEAQIKKEKMNAFTEGNFTFIVSIVDKISRLRIKE